MVEIQFVAKPFFVFHHINAYEADHQIVVDLCCYDDGKVVRCLTLENIRNHVPTPVPVFRRFVLPLHVSKVSVLIINPYLFQVLHYVFISLLDIILERLSNVGKLWKILDLVLFVLFF